MTEGQAESKIDNTEYEGKSGKNKILMAVLFFVLVLLLLWVLLDTKTEDVQFNSEKAERYTGEFQVSYGGNVYHMSLPASSDAKAGEKIVITGVLSEGSIEGNSMIFYARQSKVSVYLDGEWLTGSDREQKTPFPMSYGSRWYFFRLPADYEGKTLQIEILPQFDSYAKELPTIYMGTKSSFVFMILKQGAFSIICSLPILLLGLIMFLMGILLKNRGMATRLMWFGLFAIATSTWSLLESRITQFFLGNMVVASFLLFSCFFLIPFLAVSFLLTFDSLNRKKSMHVLLWISAGSFLVVQLLQITGIAYYIEMVPVTHILLIFIIAEMVKSYATMKRSGNGEEDASLYKAIIVLGVFCGIDIIYYYLKPAGIVGKCSKAGILIFFFYLGYSAIGQINKIVVREERHKIYRELAFTDIMTGLSNRTAFENKLSELREKEKGDWIIFVADMNNLKYINDNFGHAKGDEMLIKIGYLLQQCFQEKCSCYRIGGDEFCVISSGVKESDFEQKCKKFEKSIEDENRVNDSEHELSVAFGYCVVDESGIDECFKKADSRMYVKKAEYKNRMNTARESR